MAKRTSPTLIALGSAAIVSLWGAGYLVTRPAAAAMAASEAAAASNPSPTAVAVAAEPRRRSVDDGEGQSGFRGRGEPGFGEEPPAAASTGTRTRSVSNPAPVAGIASSGATATLLKDGTYAGSGMGRRGGVNVSVTIANGKIASATITSLTIHYPHNVISGLPPQVVAKQSSQVDLVSGATDSSLAFRQAVTQALNKAKVA